MFCRSCGVTRRCNDPVNPITGRRKGICERPIDERGMHLRSGKRYSQIREMR